jgi:hypothetical protein
MSGSILVASQGMTLISQKGKHFDDPVAWKNADSWADPAPHIERATSLLLINDTDAAHDFPAPAGGWHLLDGKAIAKPVTVAPFRSLVVIRSGDAIGLPPYVMASGIDYRAPSTAPVAGKGGKHKPLPASGGPHGETAPTGAGTAPPPGNATGPTIH